MASKAEQVNSAALAVLSLEIERVVREIAYLETDLEKLRNEAGPKAVRISELKALSQQLQDSINILVRS